MKGIVETVVAATTLVAPALAITSAIGAPSGSPRTDTSRYVVHVRPDASCRPADPGLL